MVKTAVADIIGKTITGMVFKKGRELTTQPYHQLFLLFSDGTYYELYTANPPGIMTTGGVDKGGLDEVLAYGEHMLVEYVAVLGPDGKVSVKPPE